MLSNYKKVMKFIGYCPDGLHTQLSRAPLVQISKY